MKLGNATGGDKRMLDELWSQAFDEAKLCGLNQFLSQGLTCLMGSVTFEEFCAWGLKKEALQNRKEIELNKHGGRRLRL